MDPIPLQAPYLGVNERIPIAAVEAPQCENMLNFNPNYLGASLRNGDSKYSAFNLVDGGAANFTGYPLGLFPYGSSTRLFAIHKTNFTNFVQVQDADTGANLYTTINSLATTALTSVCFNKYQFFFSDTATLAPGFVYDGAAFGACGYTGTSLTPIAGHGFKNRLYMVQRAEAAYWYSQIDAIAGACSKVSLDTITTNRCTLSCIGSFTISEQLTTAVYIAFIMSNGEVLFYSGSYPDSTDWALIGKTTIAQPLAPGATISYGGDTLVLTDAGVISLRDLFLSGSKGLPALNFSSNAQKTWTALVSKIRTALSTPTGPIVGGYSVGTIKGVYDSTNNRVIVSFPYYINSSGNLTAGSYYFVYNTLLQSWYFHRSFGGTIFDMALYKNKVLALTNLYGASPQKVVVYQKEGASGFTDRNSADSAEVGYDYEIKSAAISAGRTFVCKGEGLDVILNSDLYGQTNWYLIRDLGVSSTTAQVLSGAVSGSLQKPFINIGIEGSYIQWKLSGTTTTGKTVGLQLYGINFWQNMGESPR